jgi:hypothetical protein
MKTSDFNMGEKPENKLIYSQEELDWLVHCRVDEVLNDILEAGRSVAPASGEIIALKMVFTMLDIKSKNNAPYIIQGSK